MADNDLPQPGREPLHGSDVAPAEGLFDQAPTDPGGTPTETMGDLATESAVRSTVGLLAGPSPEPTNDASTPGRPHPARIALLPVGGAVIAAALMAITDQGLWVQGLVVFAGIAFAYVGLDSLLAALFRRPVDTAFGLAAAWLLVVVLAALFADVLPLAEARDPGLTLTEMPRLRPDLFSAHPLGTDSQALDILGGVIYGARVSLQVSLVAVLVGTVLGGFIGMAAAYYRGWLDRVVGILTDSVLAFPPLVLLLAAAAVVKPSVFTIAIALALVTVPTYVRLARANTLALVDREFIMAARVLGAKDSRILLREMVPNVLRPLAAYSFIIVAVLIVAEASLSYLGVGIQRPTPTWGNMISAGQNEFQRNPHLVFAPGLVMFLTVFALNQIGDRVRTFWDPRESNL